MIYELNGEKEASIINQFHLRTLVIRLAALVEFEARISFKYFWSFT